MGHDVTIPVERGSRDSRRPVIVLHSVVRPNSQTNPFADLLVQNLPSSITSLWFSWKQAFAARYDVVHLQWPENLMRSPSRRKSAAKLLAFEALLLRWRLTGVRPVITVHNLEPHEELTRFQRAAMRRAEALAGAFIVLTDAVEAPVPTGAKVVVIPHGDYRQRFSSRQEGAEISGRLIYFGAIRKYKNVPSLIHAFNQSDPAGNQLSLVVAGRPYDAELSAAIFDAAGENVELILDELEEDELVAQIAKAELAVLPYSKMYNSGAVFLALTIGVPVLVPKTPTTTELASEVGPDWVHLYDGELGPGTILEALRQVRSNRAEQSDPRLSGRDWRALGERYAEVYQTLARRAPISN